MCIDPHVLYFLLTLLNENEFPIPFPTQLSSHLLIILCKTKPRGS